MKRLSVNSTQLCFALTILISAFLVFQVQPIISKTILPWFGGSPAVWTTCMLFFQLFLCAGYSYAHWLTTYIRPRAQGVLHFTLIVLALCLLPITPSDAWKPDGNQEPTSAILLILLTHVGLPYFLLSATGPLLQAWYARREVGDSPYRLYALSNIGSLTALLSYPFAVEPSLNTNAQGQIWALTFCGFATLCAYLAAGQARVKPLVRQRDPRHDLSCTEEPPRRYQYVLWLILPAFASMMLLSTTNHVCQDIAVIPFLWVVPLSLYLLTFIICFDREAWYSRRWYPAFGILALLGIHGSVFFGTRWSLPVEIAGYFTVLFATCMVCHGEVVRHRPGSRYLTMFYLMLSAGGALGGLTIGLVCPWLFASYLEMPVCMLGATVLLSSVFLLDAEASWLGNAPIRRAMGTLGYCFVFVVVAFVEFGGNRRDLVASTRNFYGVLQVANDAGGTSLVHGRIIHGFQFRHPRSKNVPTTYYTRDSGVGVALTEIQSDAKKRVGAIGLGIGTVAAYGKPGDYFRFYEINPAVVELAHDYFSFLQDCRAETDIILGDARLSLEREPAQHFDVLVVDAFSGDSIPTHLLTTEAFAVYLRHLQRDGILAVHISNKHLDLEPIVQRLGRAHGMAYTTVKSPNRPPYVMPASWVLLARTEILLAKAKIDDRGSARDRSTEFPMWTDQYNNLVQLLRIY